MSSASPTNVAVSPLRHLDTTSISEEAQRESRRREAYVPPVSTYRWWARRTVAVAGGVLDAIGRDHPGQILICDPFAGGGTVGLAAALRGHKVYLQDANPWATRGLSTMFGLPSSTELAAARALLHERASKLLSQAYATTFADGQPAMIAHTIRVARATCPRCDEDLALFPYALISFLQRAERSNECAWLACRAGHVSLGASTGSHMCPTCDARINPRRNYTPGREVRCWSCERKWSLEDLAKDTPFRWTVELIERVDAQRREIGRPTESERLQADEGWAPKRELGPVQRGQETRVLRRFGYQRWGDCYPDRQLVLVEHLLDEIDELKVSDTIRQVLTTAVVGSTEMAGHLSRWDRRYLKSYEAMAAHRFNFTTLSCEPNVWGASVGRGTVTRRIDALVKAADWMEEHAHGLRSDGPLPAGRRRSVVPKHVDVRVVCGSSERLLLSDASTELIWTDPPYHDDVHYSELSTLLRAWTGDVAPVDGEAVATSVGDESYESLLTAVFQECRRVLKPSGRLMLTYANREPAAWCSLFSALRSAGFRACGYEVVVSDNDVDHAKRNVRACTMDLILDLVPADRPVAEMWSPRRQAKGAQESALRLIGDWFLKVVQPTGDAEWRSDFTAALRKTAFLS